MPVPAGIVPVARCKDLRIGGKPSTTRRGADEVWSQADDQVLLDLLTVKFLGDYLTKPIYFFVSSP
jgi:hypothetical protein